MVSPARQARADRKGQTRRVGQRGVKHEVSLRVHRNSAAGLRGRAAGEGQVGNARSSAGRLPRALPQLGPRPRLPLRDPGAWRERAG